MRSPFIKTFEQDAGKEKIRLNKRVATFLCCVFISMLFWLLMTLSKEYVITVIYPVNYVNAPADKVVANNLPTSMSLEVKSKGFFLLAYKFHDPQTVHIDLNESKSLGEKNHYYLLTNSQVNKITHQFSSRVAIQRVIPDTIYLNYNKKIKKRVPVRANLSIDIDTRYQLSDSLQLNPSFVEVSGAADVISKIDHVETLPMSLKNVDKPQTIILRLKNDSVKGDVEMSVSEIKAFVNVKKFTEASIELPIEAINLPSGYSLKSFPDKVSVKYNVAFDNYEKINAQQFRAVIDYKKADPGSNKLKIYLEKYPIDIRSVKLSPEKVEYILKK
ncbi:MAG: uncharacterized protein K0Q95_3342 [Bacteroidota bacterium]|jgi:YbbR domain-containing protein|nr:uncharacterized protein [Bacteroidota bacterium]